LKKASPVRGKIRPETKTKARLKPPNRFCVMERPSFLLTDGYYTNNPAEMQLWETSKTARIFRAVFV
jgi:hypothetical protein